MRLRTARCRPWPPPRLLRLRRCRRRLTPSIMQTKFILCTLIAVLALMLAGAAAASSSQQHHTWEETELVLALDKIRAGEYDRALDDLTNLIDARPHFKLAQFVYGQLMVARTGRTPPAELRRQLQGVRLAMIDEARVRWRHRRDTSARHDRVSAAIIRLAPQYEHVLLADLSHNRLYLFANDNGLPHLLGDFYATIGSNGLDKYSAGDMRTPIGIYRITGFHDGAELPDRYGAGAFPLDYPYALDRRDGRTGHGIWLHGVPRTTFARPPRASDGCVAAANDIILWLRDYIDPGQTPIILTHDLQWLSRDQAPARRASAEAALHDWIESWEALDKER